MRRQPSGERGTALALLDAATSKSARTTMENQGSGRADNGQFAERGEGWSAQAREQIDKMRDQANEVGERFVELVRERPFASLCIAAAAGYLLGRLAR
jgi:ElaB/YqjD/DUF883 family membrane-anchored ribosome-binding protein